MTALVMALAVATFGSAVAGDGWITIDRDVLIAFETGAEPAAAEAIAGIEDPLGVRPDVIAVPMDDERIVELSEFIHERYRRCGGFVWHGSREEAYEAAARAAAVRNVEQMPAPVPYTIDNGPVATALVNAIKETEIRKTITVLSDFFTRYHNCTSGEQSANWIYTRWNGYKTAAGRTDVTVSLFPHSGYATMQPSVILTIPGTVFPNEVVVLGAHQDSIAGTNCSSSRSPGADDDASGVATITEAIRVAMELGFRPERTVKFMAYAAEEVGLRGSQQIAQQHRQQNVNVVGVLQFDMTNYSGTRAVDITFISDFTNFFQDEFVLSLSNVYVPARGTARQYSFTNNCGYACSDHASWTQQSYPASFPFESRFGQHNMAIHTSNDTLATTGGTASHSVPFAKLAAAYMAELAKGVIQPFAPAQETPAAKPRARRAAAPRQGSR